MDFQRPLYFFVKMHLLVEPIVQKFDKDWVFW